MYLAPIDMVEDRMRNRVVGVAALFVIYLFIGSSFITEQPGKELIVRVPAAAPRTCLALARDRPCRVPQLTEKVTFASFYSTFGPNLTNGATPVKINVVNTQEEAFYLRECPALGKAICDANGSAVAHVDVTATVEEISYPVKPENTLDCSNGPTSDRTRHAGAVPYVMVDVPCTPVLRNSLVPTDETGTASFGEFGQAQDALAHGIHGEWHDGANGGGEQGGQEE